MQAPTDQAAEAASLSPAGWLFMLVSLAFVLALALWCFRRVLAGPKTVPEPVQDRHSA